MASPAIPPTTPPAIAPVLLRPGDGDSDDDEDDDDDDDGDGDGVAVVVVFPWKMACNAGLAQDMGYRGFLA